MSLGDNKLKKIHDPRQIAAMLLAAKEKHHPVFVWRIVGDKKIMAEVRLDLVITARQEIRFSPLPESQQEFASVIGGCETVNLFFPHSAILFQSTIKGTHGQQGLIVTLPSFVAHMERRLWLRMSGENHSSLRIQFNKRVKYPNLMNQFFSKALNDLSAGGVSFLATKTELRLLAEGEVIKDVEVLVEGKKIKVDVCVSRIQQLVRQSYNSAHGTVYKVSLCFERIDKKDQDSLAKFVFQHIPPTHQAV